MRDTDAFSWYMEGDPVLRSTVVSVIWLDRDPEWERLLERVDLVTRLIPSFRQCAVEPPARMTPPRWTNDPDFDLTWHVRRVVAPDGDKSFVTGLARTEAMTGFDRSRPLWRITLVEGLAEGKAAVVMALHHSLTDGVGGIQLALLLFDRVREPAPLGPGPEAPAGEHAGLRQLLQEHFVNRTADTLAFVEKEALAAPGAWWSFVRRPLDTVKGGIATGLSVGRTVRPVTRTLSPIMTGRSLGRHLDFLEVELAALKKGAATAEGSLNDGFLAAVTGGLRRYHDRHGSAVGDLRVTMPINLRTPNDPPGGNRITLMRFLVPAGEADSAKRITVIKERSRAARREPSLPHTNAIAAALNLLPPAAAGAMLKHVDFVASDVPGFTDPVYLAGSEVERHGAFGPTTGAAINVTLLSYRRTCCVGVTVDTAAVPDPECLMHCLREGFDEVVALGSPGQKRLRGKAEPAEL